jgi:hypothetical protein
MRIVINIILMWFNEDSDKDYIDVVNEDSDKDYIDVV